MKERKELVNIRVEQIYPHPDNPRKNVGDITELTESVAKNGIMQNLTVIPISALDEEPDKQPKAEELSLLSDFHVLIGHRRLAASKAAGLKEVPCRIVSQISKKEQVSIMLEENMQRSDLTIYEQAQGFQMMLDLGETAETIAEKTGFSKATVYHRLNLAKLDQTELEKKEKDDSFQMSLKDLYELEKVEDLETRNKILSEARNSNDLAYKAQQAVKEAKKEKFISKLIPMLEEKGITRAPKKVENERWSGKWDDLKSYDTNGELPDEIKVQARKKDKLLYVKWWDQIHIIRAAEKKKETTWEKEQKERDQKKKELKAITKQLIARTIEFIKFIIDGTIKPVKETEKLRKDILDAALRNGTSTYRSNIIKFFAGKTLYECTEQEKASVEEKLNACSSLQLSLILMALGIEDISEIHDYNGKCNKERAEKLVKVYDVLEQYGWTFEEHEQQLLDGTHELYTKE